LLKLKYQNSFINTIKKMFPDLKIMVGRQNCNFTSPQPLGLLEKHGFTIFSIVTHPF
jgi:hypothetical protein